MAKTPRWIYKRLFIRFLKEKKIYNRFFKEGKGKDRLLSLTTFKDETVYFRPWADFDKYIDFLYDCYVREHPSFNMIGYKVFGNTFWELIDHEFRDWLFKLEKRTQ